MRISSAWVVVMVVVVVIQTGAGCGDGSPSGEPCFEPTVPAARCDPAAVSFSLGSTNPYYPLIVGSETVLEGTEDGELIRVERRVLADTEVVAGVTTHVLEAKEFVDGALYEVARNFYVEAADGTVCYFGEFVEFYENDVVVNNDGSWRADEAGAAPGVIMPAAPAVGDAYFQENAPGIAIDMGRVVEIDGTLTANGQAFTEVVSVLDSNPLDGCEDEEAKHYVPGIGEAGDTVKVLVSHVPGNTAR